MKILSNKKYYELILKSCKGMFGAVTDDMLLRENALLNEENEQLKSILTELEEYLGKITKNGASIEKITCSNILVYLKELKEKYK